MSALTENYYDSSILHSLLRFKSIDLILRFEDGSYGFAYVYQGEENLVTNTYKNRYSKDDFLSLISFDGSERQILLQSDAVIYFSQHTSFELALDELFSFFGLDAPHPVSVVLFPTFVQAIEALDLSPHDTPLVCTYYS